jgi:tRNA G10  N-methylase Trm11
MLWAKGIGLNTALMGCAFLKNIANADCIIDPFCGVGTILAMANCLGVNSIGIEISERRCRKARSLQLYKQLDEMKASLRRQMGLLDYTSSIITENAKDDKSNNDDTIDNNENNINNENLEL